MRIEFKSRMSRALKEEVKSAIKFFLQKLDVPKEVSDQLRLKIKTGTNGLEGYVEVLSRKQPLRSFEIFVKRGGDQPLLLNLAHEIVHVKQYAMAEADDIDGKSYWKGKRWKFKKKENNYGYLDRYYDSPWEIEAHGKERGLYIRYMDHMHQNFKNREALLGYIDDED